MVGRVPVLGAEPPEEDHDRLGGERRRRPVQRWSHLDKTVAHPTLSVRDDLLGPVDPSFRARYGRLKLTV